jgi:hypothetical protein
LDGVEAQRPLIDRELGQREIYQTPNNQEANNWEVLIGIRNISFSSSKARTPSIYDPQFYWMGYKQRLSLVGNLEEGEIWLKRGIYKECVLDDPAHCHSIKKEY